MNSYKTRKELYPSIIYYLIKTNITEDEIKQIDEELTRYSNFNGVYNEVSLAIRFNSWDNIIYRLRNAITNESGYLANEENYENNLFDFYGRCRKRRLFQKLLSVILTKIAEEKLDLIFVLEDRIERLEKKHEGKLNE